MYVLYPLALLPSYMESSIAMIYLRSNDLAAVANQTGAPIH